MAFANSSVSDIIATNIESRSGELADNVTNNNALLRRVDERGNRKPVSGGSVILQEIMYNDTTTNNTNSYSGYEVLNVSQNSPISAAQFSFTQYASAVSISGLDQLMNSGKEAIIDLLESRMQIAEKQLMNSLSAGIYSAGTGNSSKDITGLQAAIADAPSSGTYGGINRATWSFWRNVAFSAATDGGAAATSANIQSYMNRVAIQLVRGNDAADIAVADTNYYRLYLESLQSIQRIASEEMGNLGFTALKYFGAGRSMDVVLDGGIGGAIGTNRMYMLNTDYIFLRQHRDRTFVPIGGERQSINQDAVVKLIGWAGNLT